MDDKIKLGLIGAGAVAQITHIPIWQKLDEVELVAVCDTQKNKAKWVAEKYNIPNVFDDGDDFLKLEEMHAVDVCTPTQSHMQNVMAALSSDRHVIVEKPMALNYSESKTMVEAAQKYEKMLMVAMNVRFRQDAIILKSFTKNNELGEIFYCKAGWLQKKEKYIQRNWFAQKEISGGGVIMDLGIQMLDVGLWLMGNPRAENVKAATFNQSAKLNVEDVAVAFIGLQNGATLTVEVSWTLLSDKDLFYANFFGTGGGALLNPLRIHKELHGNLVNVSPSRSESRANLYKKSYENEMKHFITCIREKSVLSSSGAENLERMRIVDAIYESARSGREVILK